MKVNPRYKCRACGKVITLENHTAMSIDEVECFSQSITHICDVKIIGDERLDQDVQEKEYVGICNLVGYVEVKG